MFRVFVGNVYMERSVPPQIFNSPRAGAACAPLSAADNAPRRSERAPAEIPRVFAVFWLGVLFFFILSAGASATLTYDLRVAGGGKNVTVQTTGQVVNLELYAVVTGAVGNSALEGFQDGYVSILS